jgi:ABC-type multidrug transport system fused ATPase/permease subunit
VREPADVVDEQRVQADERYAVLAVVEHGRIAEIGSHDELLGADGHYAALWHAWRGGVAV